MTQREQALRPDASDYPEGHYTDVRVVPIQGQSGNLSGGTGTFEHGVFGCGDFSDKDRPAVGQWYNLSGKQDKKFYEFARWKCVHSDKTSEFKEK
ncbi:MAG: hypothetical protein JWN14_3085 [Chthonomonadales bacterium]|nr:hypothetical protein [Chthonomonadales bacterium]